VPSIINENAKNMLFHCLHFLKCVVPMSQVPSRQHGQHWPCHSGETLLFKQEGQKQVFVFTKYVNYLIRNAKLITVIPILKPLYTWLIPSACRYLAVMAIPWNSGL